MRKGDITMGSRGSKLQGSDRSSVQGNDRSRDTNPSGESRDFWRTLVGDKQKAQKRVQEELPEKKEQIRNLIDNVANKSIVDLIVEIREIKQWLEERKGTLNFNYKPMRVGYNNARDAHMKGEGTENNIRKEAADFLAAVHVALERWERRTTSFVLSSRTPTHVIRDNSEGEEEEEVR
jgi:hypothetical protein